MIRAFRSMLCRGHPEEPTDILVRISGNDSVADGSKTDSAAPACSPQLAAAGSSPCRSQLHPGQPNWLPPIRPSGSNQPRGEVSTDDTGRLLTSHSERRVAAAGSPAALAPAAGELVRWMHD